MKTNYALTACMALMACGAITTDMYGFTPLTDAIMRSLWNSTLSPKNGAVGKSDEPRTEKFHDAQTGTHFTMTSDKDQESCCIIESESYKESTITDVRSKPKFWLSIGKVATFEFDLRKTPQLSGTPTTFGISDPYTKCEGTVTFRDDAKDPDILKAERHLRCTTKLSREQYFGYLLNLSEEDETITQGNS